MIEAETFGRSNQYRQLAAKVFTNVDAWVDRKPMRIPYVTVVLECEK